MSGANKSKSGRHVPFGYRRADDGALVADPMEAPIRKKIYELFLQHGRKQTVAKLLNEAGDRTRDGSEFSDVAVGRLLRDPNVFGETKAPFAVEALISKETWQQCQELLRTSATKTPVHLFAGIVRCQCGQKMYVATDSDKYLCEQCRNKISISELESIFVDQFKACFLVPVAAKTGETKPVEAVQMWPRLSHAERRQLVESMIESIIVAEGGIEFNLYFLPSVEIATNGQQQQIVDTTRTRVSTSALVEPLRINLGARELWEGKTQLTHLLNETTRNFLGVLAANVANHMTAPLDPNMPFTEDATATAKSALDMLRRQIGSERCKRLIQQERRRGGKLGGIKLANAEVAGTGRRDSVSFNPLVPVAKNK